MYETWHSLSDNGSCRTCEHAFTIGFNFLNVFAIEWIPYLGSVFKNRSNIHFENFEEKQEVSGDERT